MEINEWRLLGYLIGDRNSQEDFKTFCAEHKYLRQETHAMLKEWQKMHPYASWTLLYQALIKMDEKIMSKFILKYISGLFEVFIGYACAF